MKTPGKFEAIPYTPKWWKSEGILGEIFRTQNALKIRIRSIINQAEYNAPLAEADEAFLIDVLRRHHNWEMKQGAGIVAVVVRVNPSPGFGPASRGLWLIRADSSEVDISWIFPLQRGGANSAKNDLSRAARREVSDQTCAVYNRHRGTNCPICGKVLLTGHVDHIAPLTFDRLLSDWLAVEGVNVDDVNVADLGVENAFVDRELATRWSHYHLANAKLRLIHLEENLSSAKLEARPKQNAEPDNC